MVVLAYIVHAWQLWWHLELFCISYQLKERQEVLLK